MPRFAHFDHTVDDPSPVLGWFDTDLIAYPSLPAEADLIEVPDDLWTGRTSRHWAVQDGALVAYQPAPAPEMIVADRIRQGMTLMPSGAVLSMVDGMEDLRLAAMDANAGLGLPGGGETFDARTTYGSTIALTESAVILVYRAMRDALTKLGWQVAIMKRGEEPVWPEQTITLEPKGTGDAA